MGAFPVPAWVAPTLTVVILVYYAFALWWFLRREPVAVLVGLLGIAALSLGLRLIYVGDFPDGLNYDEPLILAAGIQQRAYGYIFNDGTMGHTVFLASLFQAPLAPIVGPFWAIRFYSLVTSVLCVPLAYSAARALGLRVAASLAAAILVAVLPWSLFWGRASVGGELTFHQLLMVVALCRMIFGTAGAVDAVIGGVGLSLLLYDYPVGRCLLPLPLGAALLARGQRLHCLALLAIGVLCWAPYVYGSSKSLSVNGPLSIISHRHDPALVEDPFWGAISKTGSAVSALVRPIAADANVTVAAAGVHPVLVLALALVGSLLCFRRGAFLWGGFVLALAPAIIGIGRVSAHRMMMAYPFIALAAASALDGVRRFRPPAWLVVAVVGVISFQSVQFYFSDAFWLPGSKETFDADHTRLLQALPWDHKVIAGNMPMMIEVWGMSGGNFERLTTSNWLAEDEKVVYAFAKAYEPLEPVYRRVLGDRQVRRFGRAFMATLEPADSERLSTHGWAYVARCGEQTTTANVPFLYVAFCSAELKCDQPTGHEWSAVWNEKPSTLRLEVPGNVALVTTSRQSHRGVGSITFPVETGDRLTISVTSSSSLIVSLYVQDANGERIPDWEALNPAPAAAQPRPEARRGRT